jgi:hypothetical protein
MRQERQPLSCGGGSRPPFTALDAPYLRGVALATLAALGLVSLNVAGYGNRAWAGRYLFSGLWALVFFAFTPLILKAMLFDGRTGRGLLLILAKLVWLGVMVAACWYWARPGSPPVAFATSLLLGVGTPLIVVTLRALGSLLRTAPAGRAVPADKPEDSA